MADNRGIVFGRDVEDRDRLLEHDALRDVDVRAVFKECGVERAERIPLEIQIAAEVLFDGSRISRDFRGEAGDRHALRQLSDRGKRRNEASVYENQARSYPGHKQRCESFL